MLKLTISRPNTIGVYIIKEYDSYSEAENYIESKVESLVNKGFEVNKLSGSNSQSGTIEAMHDNEADVLLIQWRLFNYGI